MSSREIAERQAEVEAVYAEIFGERIAKREAAAARARANDPSRQSVSLPDQELIERARAARNGARFAALFDRGDWKGEGFSSQSEADLWFCGLLAFWFGRDAARMDRVYRSSALMRAKWDREDYSSRTLDAAVANCADTFNPFTPTPKPKLTVVPDAPKAKKPADSEAPSAEKSTRSRPPADDQRPIVDYVDGLDLKTHSAEAWKHLQAGNDPPTLYAQRDKIVRIDRDHDSARAHIVPCGRHELAHQLGEVARFLGPKGKTDSQWTQPPSALVYNLLVTPQKPLPPLMRLTHVPVFTDDGRLINQAGYDLRSGIFYDPCDLIIGAIGDCPSEAEVDAAVKLLKTPLAEFPFIDPDADRATCLALMIERFARDLIRGCLPLYLFNAAKVGSGKGLCARVCLYPALGGLTNRPPARNEEAAAKRLLAVLKEADELYLVDNQTGLLNSESLAAALTTPFDGFYSDRLLGVTGSGTFPVRFSTVVTANNARLSGDMWRRTPTHVRIVVKQENPEDRTFQCDLAEWLPANRAPMIRAILTLIQNWIARGRPAWGGIRIGSFEQWCDVIGGILQAAHVDGFLSKYKERRAVHNDRATAEREFVKALFEDHNDDPLTARDLLPLALPIELFNLSNYGEPGDPEATLRKQATALGRWLSRNVGGVFGEFQIEAPKYTRGIKYYRLGPAAG